MPQRSKEVETPRGGPQSGQPMSNPALHAGLQPRIQSGVGMPSEIAWH